MRSSHFMRLQPLQMMRRNFFTKQIPQKNTNELVVKEYSSKELSKLQEITKFIKNDEIVEISKNECNRFLVQLPRADLSPLQKLKFEVWDKNKEFKFTAWKYIHLILERLENVPLTGILDIDETFNARAYFYMLHVWLLHRRLITEGFAGKMIDENLFDFTWTVFKDWLILKNTPEHQFESELRNCQSCMMGFCVALDMSLDHPETAAGRIKDVLQETLYGGQIPSNAPFLDLLTKYVLRQTSFITQIDRDHFLTSYFVWSSFPVIDELSNPKVIAALSHRINYGGYKPKAIESIKLLRRGLILPLVRETPPEQLMQNTSKQIE